MDKLAVMIKKTPFPWGHGVYINEWEEVLPCFVESFIPFFERCTLASEELQRIERFNTELVFFFK
jgi:hypothetical protein